MRWIRDLVGKLRGDPNRMSQEIAALVAMSRAEMEARTIRWRFKEGTMTLDPEVASLEEINAALSDCNMCAALEYPETEDGTYRAERRREVLQEAMVRRFPEESRQLIWDDRRRTMREAVITHGGPMPAWVSQEEPPAEFQPAPPAEGR